MICRNCGTTIADKAIVCFRCGTPTDLPVAPASPARSRGPAWVGLVRQLLLGVLLFAGLAWVGVPTRLSELTVVGFAKLLGVVVAAIVLSDLAARALRRPPTNRSRPV